jgi:hypothetical protein
MADATPTETTMRQRILTFVEQPLLTTAAGVMGGIVGAFFYTPVCIVCDACVLLALHRSKSVADKGIKTQIACYLSLCIATTVLLLTVGHFLRKEARTYTKTFEEEIISGIRSVTESSKLDSAIQKTGAKETAQSSVVRETILKPPAYMQVDKVKLTGMQAPIRAIAEVYYGNYHGQAPADLEFADAKPFFVRDPPSPAVENKLFSAFEKTIPRKLATIIQMGIGDGSVLQLSVPEIKPENVNNDLFGGGKWLYVMGGMIWKDPVGEHRKGFCYYLWPPNIKRLVPSQVNPLAFLDNWMACNPDTLKKWELGHSERDASSGNYLAIVECVPGTHLSDYAIAPQTIGAVATPLVVDGSDAQLVPFPTRPRKIFVDPPGTPVDVSELPKEITFGKCKVADEPCKLEILEFRDNGVVINGQGAVVRNGSKRELCTGPVIISVTKTQQ